MPGQRAPGQKQVLTMFDEKFLAEVERAMRRAGYSDRSKFIRDAVFEKLKKVGVTVDYTLAMAPSRTRTGHVAIINGGSGHSIQQSSNVNEEPPVYGVKAPKKITRKKK